MAWIVEIVDFLLPITSLDHYGILPRTKQGLAGIFLAPFLHGGFAHLISNSIPFLVLGGVVVFAGVRVFVEVSFFVILVGGFCVWLFAPAGTVHIGASGVIFGYLGFLLARGIFERSWKGFFISVITLIFYGGLLFGLLPGTPGVSWQGHLFGFIAGVISAWAMFPPRWA